MRCFFFVGLCGIFLSACTFSSSPEDVLRKKAERVVVELTETLQAVQTHEELQAVSVCLKKKFTQLAHLILEVKRLRQGMKGQQGPLYEMAASDALFIELARLYEIPGCREVIERSQSDAIHVLLR